MNTEAFAPAIADDPNLGIEKLFLIRVDADGYVIEKHETNINPEGLMEVSRADFEPVMLGKRWRVVDGALLPCEPPPEPVTQADYSLAIQMFLDGKARERQYDGIHTAIGYRDDPNPNFAAEALELFIWRSAVWTYSSAELAKVTAGERPQPTVAEFMTELEAACPFVWPMQRPAMLGGQLPVE
ncbi:hypothetical protein N182_28940 [Sinorhizobium sp. GL2]|nr:hypothetical protein N182_28940 [Sinorhizobium sp. GL2]